MKDAKNASTEEAMVFRWLVDTVGWNGTRDRGRSVSLTIEPMSNATSRTELFWCLFKIIFSPLHYVS